MAVELEGLEFQIEANSTEAGKGIDALTGSLKRLKSALGGKQLGGIADKLKTISAAASGLKGVDLNGLASTLNALGSVKISATIPKRLTDISSAVNSITSDGVDRIERMTAALEGLKGVDLPNLSKIVANRPKKTAKSDAPAAKKADAVQSQSIEEIADTESAGLRLNTVLASVRSTLTGLSQETYAWSNMLKNVSGQYAAAFKIAKGEMKAAKSQFESAANSAKAMGKRFSEAFKNGTLSAEKLKTVLHNLVVQGTEGLATLPLKLPAAFSKAGSALKTAMGTAFAGISTKTFPGFEGLVSSLKTLGTALGSVCAKIRTFTAAFSALASGMGTVVKYVSGFNAVTKSVKKLGEGVKNTTSQFKKLYSTIYPLNKNVREGG